MTDARFERPTEAQLTALKLVRQTATGIWSSRRYWAGRGTRQIRSETVDALVARQWLRITRSLNGNARLALTPLGEVVLDREVERREQRRARA